MESILFPLPHTSVAETQEEIITFGKVQKKTFWSVFLVSCILLGCLLFSISRGYIAVAAALPTPFTVKADFFQIVDSRLVLGISAAGHNDPVAITTDDAIARNLRISKEVSLPGIGNVTFTLQAGKHSDVKLYGTRTDVRTLQAHFARIEDSVTTIDDRNGVKVTSGLQQFTNVTIKAPYLSFDSGTFPDISITVKRT